MNSPQLWQKNSRCVAQNPIVKSLYFSSFLVLSSCNREKKVGLSTNMAPVMECLLWAYKMSHTWQFDHHWLLQVWCRSGQWASSRKSYLMWWMEKWNCCASRVHSPVHGAHMCSGRFGCIIIAGWFLHHCVTFWTNPSPTSV